MTDKPNSLAAAFAELGAAIEGGLDELGQAVAGQVPYAAGKALNACLEADDEAARQALAGLNAEQCRTVFDAAVRLGRIAMEEPTR